VRGFQCEGKGKEIIAKRALVTKIGDGERRVIGVIG
jgi:hypothetical protein